MGSRRIISSAFVIFFPPPFFLEDFVHVKLNFKEVLSLIT